VDNYFSLNNRRYLGAKTKLLKFINEIVEKEFQYEKNTFLDLFAGTGVVGYRFSDSFKNIYTNDLLVHNYIALNAFFSNEKINLDLLKTEIDKCSQIKGSVNYYSKNFGDKFFSLDNAKKIGSIRTYIDSLDVSTRMRHALLTSLFYATDKVANTVGHYDAFRRGSEVNNPLVLKFPNLKNWKRKNYVFNVDSNKLVRDISTKRISVTYIDPPYNSRQYSDAYHLLENLVENKEPDVFGEARKMDRTHIKSKYSNAKATEEFKDLIENLNTEMIVFSYNNTGKNRDNRSNALISDESVHEILESKGKVKMFEKEFNEFTVGKTTKRDHTERLFVCKVQ
jgi:adenine-specific DNA-methyltransferase